MAHLFRRRRLLCCVAAAVLLFLLTAPPASSAAYYLRFYDDFTGVEEQNTEILEESAITIRSKLPPDHKFDKPPFAVSKGEQSITADDIFTLASGGNNSYTLISKDGSAGTDGRTSYVLNALYSAIVSETTNAMALYAGDQDNEPEQYGMRVVSADRALSITTDSTLTFTATADQNTTGMVMFSNVSATNGFSNYDGQPISSQPYDSDSGGRFFMLRIQSKNPADLTPLNLKVYPQNLPKDHIIRKGTKFSITFQRQALNSMILSIISAEKAVEETMVSVREKPTSTTETVMGRPYILLKAGEGLDSIQSNFTLLSRVHRYNVDMDIKWEWVPDDPIYQKNVTINTTRPGIATFEINDPPLNDIRGSLHATVSYTPKLGQTTTHPIPAKIPLLIYGTGTPPALLPMRTETGNPGQTPNPKVEDVAKLPGIMDVYRGDAKYDPSGEVFEGYKTKPKGPYRFIGSLDFGTARGAAKTLKIVNHGEDAVDIFIDNSPTPYAMGSELKNPGGAKMPITITTKTLGVARLEFQFYNDKGELMREQSPTQIINVYDTRPSTDGRLKTLGIHAFADNQEGQDILESIYTNPKAYIPFSFNPDTNTYTVEVPNRVENVQIAPRIPSDTGASTKVVVAYDTNRQVVTSGNESVKIPLLEQQRRDIDVTVTAQDGSTNTYMLRVARLPKSQDSTAKLLSAKSTAAPNSPELVPAFSPGKLSYDISVPYATEQIKVEAATGSPWAKAAFDTDSGSYAPLYQKTVDLNYEYPPDDILNPTNNRTTVTFHVWAEDGSSANDYTLNITRLPPSDNRQFSALSVQDADGKELAFVGGQKFSPDVLDYAISIPYSTEKLKVIAQPADPLALEATLTHAAIYGGAAETRSYRGAPLAFKFIDVAQESTHNPDKDIFNLTVTATAESGKQTDPPYTIEVLRAAPDTNNYLSSLAVTDEAGKAIPDYTFQMYTQEYDVVVPYISRSVNVTPVADSVLSAVTVDGKKVSIKAPTVNVKLDPGVKRDIAVTVTAESGDVLTYVLHTTRAKPSNEARLADLKVGALTLKPVFVPSKTEYEVTIPKPGQNFTITPTAIDPHATINIGGKTIASGATTAPITPDAAETYTEVVVTAQDGQTKKVYRIKVLTEGLFPSSNNADLKQLQVKDGSMTPKFKPGIYDYEMAVKRDTTSVDIFPIPAEPHATMTVASGSKLLGDYNSNYSTALTSDKTDITVTVESQDKTVKNEYKVTIYRNNEEKEGKYKPITADMVDYTQDPIIVDVSVYPIVAADVFNTLKTDHPEKTIIIKGNDYAFECKGSDMKQLVPNTELYDFSLSFTSPEEPNVRSLLDRTGNGGLQPVYVYFTHHGPLPASMKFTLSLGSAYKNKTLYWNYYNTERDRIDFYGTVRANTKGTFTVPISHMSTYLITTTYINGAEDKSGMEGGVNGNLSSAVTSGKRNPSTTAEEDAQP